MQLNVNVRLISLDSGWKDVTIFFFFYAGMAVNIYSYGCHSGTVCRGGTAQIPA
jgi:hypothetical protein